MLQGLQLLPQLSILLPHGCEFLQQQSYLIGEFLQLILRATGTRHHPGA
jgi:hypothetical protein